MEKETVSRFVETMKRRATRSKGKSEKGGGSQDTHAVGVWMCLMLWWWGICVDTESFLCRICFLRVVWKYCVAFEADLCGYYVWDTFVPAPKQPSPAHLTAFHSTFPPPLYRWIVISDIPPMLCALHAVHDPLFWAAAEGAWGVDRASWTVHLSHGMPEFRPPPPPHSLRCCCLFGPEHGVIFDAIFPDLLQDEAAASASSDQQKKEAEAAFERMSADERDKVIERGLGVWKEVLRHEGAEETRHSVCDALVDHLRERVDQQLDIHQGSVRAVCVCVLANSGPCQVHVEGLVTPDCRRLMSALCIICLFL